MPVFVQDALGNVKQKRTNEVCIMHAMEFDDRPEPAKRLQQAREHAGFSSARAAALRFNWSVDSYIQHENGTRGITRVAEKYAKAFKVGAGWLLTGEGKGPGSAPDITERFKLLEPDLSELADDYIDLLLERQARRQQKTKS